IISFDFDGSFGGRESWYVDVFPSDTPDDVVDITSHVTFGPGAGHPGRFLRFAQQLGAVMISHFDVNGDYVGNISLANQVFDGVADTQLAAGALKHWELHVTQDHAAIFIGGQKVYDVVWADHGVAGLDFSRGYVEWALFGYNPIKEGLGWVQFRFDNFG